MSPRAGAQSVWEDVLSFVGIPQVLQTADNENCLALHALDLARGWLTSSGIDGLTIVSVLDLKSIFLFPMLLSASQNFQALHGVFFRAYFESILHFNSSTPSLHRDMQKVSNPTTDLRIVKFQNPPSAPAIPVYKMEHRLHKARSLDPCFRAAVLPNKPRVACSPVIQIAIAPPPPQQGPASHHANQAPLRVALPF